jgi:cell wall-associated NlpC family hydrolase
MAFSDGAPEHCGVLLGGGMLLHSEGSQDRGGSVRLTRLAAMSRLYSDIRFYDFIGGATC